MGLEIIEQPAGAVTLEDVIQHLNLITPVVPDLYDEPQPEPLPDEDLVLLYMQAAEAKIENRTGLALSERTLRLRCDAFARTIALHVAPVIAVTAVKYLDVSGDEQTLPDTVYALVGKEDAPRLVLKPGQAWPSTWDIGGAVSIEFRAGWEDSEDIPAPLRIAILQTVAAMYEFREEISEARTSEVTAGVWSLIADYVRWGG